MVSSSSNGARLPLTDLEDVIQDGLTVHEGHAPGIILVTWLYAPLPPTLVYLNAVIAPACTPNARRVGIARTKGSIVV